MIKEFFQKGNQASVLWRENAPFSMKLFTGFFIGIGFLSLVGVFLFS